MIILTLAGSAQAEVVESSPFPRPVPESIRRARHEAAQKPGLNPPEDYRSQVPGSSFQKDGAEYNCSRYIRMRDETVNHPNGTTTVHEAGTYGPEGWMLRTHILGYGRANDRSAFFLGNDLPDMPDLCPNFPNLNNEQKVNFWVWFFMSLSHDESQCGHPNKLLNTSATDGTAVGAFHINESAGDREWRGRGCRDDEMSQETVTIRQGSRTLESFVAKPDNNIMCTIEMYGAYLCGAYRIDGTTCGRAAGPMGGNSSWAKLRSTGDGNPVRRMTKEFTLCQQP